MMRQPSRRIAMVRSASSATVSAVMPPAASMAFLRQAPSAPGTTVMQFSRSKARFSMIHLMKDADACFVRKVRVQQLAGSIRGAIIDDDNVQVLQIGKKDRGDGLHDDALFIVRRD